MFGIFLLPTLKNHQRRQSWSTTGNCVGRAYLALWLVEMGAHGGKLINSGSVWPVMACAAIGAMATHSLWIRDVYTRSYLSFCVYKMSWSNEVTFEFIDLYRNEPVIWNPRHEFHKDKNKVSTIALHTI